MWTKSLFQSPVTCVGTNSLMVVVAIWVMSSSIKQNKKKREPPEEEEENLTYYNKYNKRCPPCKSSDFTE